MYMKPHQDGVIILVRVTPGASRNVVAPSGTGDRLSVKLTAPPVEGRANRDLLKILAKKLGVPPSSLSIVSGHTARDKAVLVPGLTAAEVMHRIG